MKTNDLAVRDVMSTDVVTVGPNDRLALVDELMSREHIRHVPVLDSDGELCGVITKRDLFRGALLKALGFGSRAEQHLLETILVKEAMTDDPMTTTPDTALVEASKIMLERKVGCLPVTDRDKLVGILTEGDFVRLCVEGRLP